MLLLTDGYNALNWQADTVPIASVACISQIVVVYTRNPVTGQGFISFQPGDALSVMTLFVKGYDYLVRCKGSCQLAGAGPALTDTFSDFPGYTPPVVSTAPTQAVGRTETGIAAEPIIGGRMVAQTLGGLRHYSAAADSHRHLLFGVALNSALAGGSVTVRRPGYVQFQGWGLPPDALLLAGEDGKLVTSVAPPLFLQVIGRSLSPDVLLFQPGEISLILQPQSTV